MANPRVHEIASELGVDSRVVLKVLNEMGEHVRAPSSAIPPPVARKLKERLRDGVSWPVMELFPLLDQAVHDQLVEDLLDLPQSTFSFVRGLSSCMNPESDALQLLRRIMQSGEVFYVQGADMGVFEQSVSTARPLEVRQLFARTGILVLEGKEPQKYRSYTLLGWHLSTEETLQLVWMKTSVSEETDRRGRPRLEVSAPHYAERSATNSAFALGRRREIRVLSALYSLTPVRSRNERLTSKVGEKPHASTHEESDFVRLYRYEPGTSERATSASSGIGKSSHHVRGHVRRQPYPSTGEIREIWIDAYSTGERREVEPAKKPYLVKPLARPS